MEKSVALIGAISTIHIVVALAAVIVASLATACALRTVGAPPTGPWDEASGPWGSTLSQMASLERDIVAHRPYLNSILRARGVRKAERPDLLQQVLVSALEAIRAGRYEPRPGVPLRAWLAEIARHWASKYHRRAKREEHLFDPTITEYCDERASADVAIEHSERLDVVSNCLMQDAGAGVVIAHDIDGIPMQDVAKSLGVPLSTAYKLRAKAIERVRGAARRQGAS